jgi:hypothetical protein
MSLAVNKAGEIRSGGLYDGECCLREYIIPSHDTDTLVVERRADQQEFSLAVTDDEVLSEKKLIELGFK